MLVLQIADTLPPSSMSKKTSQSTNLITISAVTAIAVGALLAVFLLKRFQKNKPKV